jgi:hypothetical protein
MCGLYRVGTVTEFRLCRSAWALRIDHLAILRNLVLLYLFVFSSLNVPLKFVSFLLKIYHWYLNESREMMTSVVLPLINWTDRKTARLTCHDTMLNMHQTCLGAVYFVDTRHDTTLSSMSILTPYVIARTSWHHAELYACTRHEPLTAQLGWSLTASKQKIEKISFLHWNQ